VRATLLTALVSLPCAGANAVPAGTQAVPMEVQDLVEAALSPHLVLPQTARWDFTFMAPYISGGNVVCGRVNYQSAMRKYVGAEPFYAIVKRGAVVVALLQDPPWVDTTGAEAERFKALCDRR